MQSSQNDLNRLASYPVGRLLWEFGLPAAVGMIVMALYNVVDRIFIGQVVGPEAIAGLAVTFPLMNITTAIGVLVGVGSSSRISIVLGAGNHKRAQLILGNAATLTFVNAAIYITAFTIWINPVLLLFGAGDATLPYAREYMLWVLPGLLMTNVAYGLNNVLRASGYPKRAMVTMLIGAVTNVVLDAIFVLWLDWGMLGAAIATDVSMGVSAVFVVSHFFKKNVNLGFARGTFSLKWNVVRDIVSIGLAPSLINVASCLTNALINRALLAHGGDIAIGAAGVFVTYTSLLVTLVLGVSMGLQPIVGYNCGAGHPERARRAFWLATATGTVICAFGSVMGMWQAEKVARAFTSDAYMIQVTASCLRHALWAFSVVGFQVMATTYFQSIGASFRSILLSLSRQVIFLVPLMLWLPSTMGVDGVWTSFPISDILATVVCAALILSAFRPR